MRGARPEGLRASEKKLPLRNLREEKEWTTRYEILLMDWAG